jgi:hypothetical protein
MFGVDGRESSGFLAFWLAWPAGVIMTTANKVYVTVTRGDETPLTEAVNEAINVAVMLDRDVVFVNGETVDLVVDKGDTVTAVLERIERHKRI